MKILWNGNECAKTEATRILREPSTLLIVIDQEELENGEYFSSLDNMITNDARCTPEIKSKIAMAKSSIELEEYSVLSLY